MAAKKTAAKKTTAKKTAAKKTTAKKTTAKKTAAKKTTAKKTAAKKTASKKVTKKVATKTTKKKKNQLTLESVLWNCRVALRNVGTLDKNRDAIISLVFLKFAGDNFEKIRKNLLEEYGNDPEVLEDPVFYNAERGFYLKENVRWPYIVENASANNIALIIDKAIADIEDSNPTLKGALTHNLFGTLGADKSKIKNLIDNVNQIDDKMFREEDLIGHVYEYFLRLYAASGTVEEGEFYTPPCIVKLIAELIEPYNGTVYDPCCGSGGMFVQSMKFVERHHGNKDEVSIVGQELQPETWRLCKMNLAIRGISNNLGDRPASTFTEDLHKDRTVDFIMANPPFNKKGWRTEDELIDDPRFLEAGYSVMPPVSNANYAWILHIISKLDTSHGIAGFLLANGALNAADDEGVLRKEILERDYVEAIIVLPREMFYKTDISVTLWIINMNKKARIFGGRQLRDRTNEILFMDLRQWNKNTDEILIEVRHKEKAVTLTDGQIAVVKEVYNSWQSADTSLYSNVPEFCKSATLDEIRAKNYSLAPSKYIEFIDHDLDINYETEMKRIQSEMRDILVSEKQSQEMLEKAFRGIGYEIY